MRRHAACLILALAALSVPASGTEAARLVSPSHGTELLAGSEVTLEWTDAGLPRLPDTVEEWEAFLSVDGGRTWPLRITPHLDISIRRFAFRVPAFPTRDARLLLRFGDERNEVELEMPQRLSISGDLHRDSWPVVLDLASQRGERARPDDPNDPGTVIWIEGSRDGSGLREVVALDSGSSLQEARSAGRLLLPLLAPGQARTALAAPAASGSAPAPEPRPVLDGTPAPRPDSVPVRLLIRRFNE
jgi:hypothetical protein